VTKTTKTSTTGQDAAGRGSGAPGAGGPPLVAWDASVLADVRELLAERVGGLLAQGEALEVEGESSADQVRARFLLSGSPKGDRLELEAKVDLAAAGLDAEGGRDLALDALDAILLDYLESERSTRYSGVFEARELGGKPLLVRAERTYPALDAAADALLSGPGDGAPPGSS